MARDDYIPADDSSFQMWAKSLCECIAGEPERYRFSAEDAAELVAAVRKFTAAYREASNPSTRTAALCRTKTDARRTCQSMCRRFAMAIKNHPSISDADKIAAGVRPIERRRERIGRPRSRPLLNVVCSMPHAVILRYADSETPDSRAKPEGVACLSLFAGDGERAAPGACRFIGAFTRTPIELKTKDDGEPLRVTLYAQWVNTRGETGPWSEPVSTVIAA